MIHSEQLVPSSCPSPLPTYRYVPVIRMARQSGFRLLALGLENEALAKVRVFSSFTLLYLLFVSTEQCPNPQLHSISF